MLHDVVKYQVSKLLKLGFKYIMKSKNNFKIYMI